MISTRRIATVALGLLAALSLSCGPLPSGCSPSTCSGCCTQGTTIAASRCIRTPENGTNATCGLAGATCDDCASRIDGKTKCTNYVCAQ